MPVKYKNQKNGGSRHETVTGGVTVASAETNIAMEGSENKLVSQSQTEKGTKIPVKSRLPLPKKHTNNHSAIPVVATNSGSSRMPDPLPGGEKGLVTLRTASCASRM